MGKPKGSIGETKLKIMAILQNNESTNTKSYGYGIWSTLNKKLFSYLSEDGLRNVYHHLKDLQNMDLIKKDATEIVKGAPKRHTYKLTTKGKKLQRKYEKYLTPLRVTSK
jgi:DNA-binding PadR family transcriptional regulator